MVQNASGYWLHARAQEKVQASWLRIGSTRRRALPSTQVYPREWLNLRDNKSRPDARDRRVPKELEPMFEGSYAEKRRASSGARATDWSSTMSMHGYVERKSSSRPRAARRRAHSHPRPKEKEASRTTRDRDVPLKFQERVDSPVRRSSSTSHTFLHAHQTPNNAGKKINTPLAK